VQGGVNSLRNGASEEQQILARAGRFLNRRGRRRLGWGDWAVFCGFVLLVGWTAPHHEPWADEAQAWLLARDNSLAGLLLHRLHYEGTPGLWYVLLWGLHRVGLSFNSMRALAILANVVAVYVLLRYSPFSAAIRWTLPFTVALAYQFPIVARSYSLIPPLVFLICMALDRRKPVLTGVLAGILANLSPISFCLSVGFMLVLPWGKDTGLQLQRRERVTSAAVFGLFLLVAIYPAIPAPDSSVGQVRALAANPRVREVLAALTGTKMVGSPPAPAAGPASAGTSPQLAPGLPESERHRRRSVVGGKFALAVVHFASLMFFPISSFNLLALLFYAALIFWAGQHHALRILLPLAAVFIGAKVLPFNEHHVCVLWCAVVAVLWLGWNHMPSGPATRTDLALASVLILVLAEQLCWTGFACGFDWFHPFSGSENAARWIQAQPGERRMAGFNYHSVAVQPYMGKNIYANQSTAYWPWSTSNDPDAHVIEALARQPEIVVEGESYDGNVSWRNQIVEERPAWKRNDPDGIGDYLLAHGYMATHRFCGCQPSHLGFSEMTCQVIYQTAEPVPKKILSARK
jgi:hypothetical protein